MTGRSVGKMIVAMGSEMTAEVEAVVGVVVVV